MYQKNRLKDLIYIQENKSCNEQTLKGLFRSVAEPVLEQNVEGIMLLRLENKSKKNFAAILKRLEFSNVKVFDFSLDSVSDKFSNVLKENIWDKTEFVYVLSERYGAVLIFDYEEADVENFANFYIMHNSKNLTDAFEIINANSKINLADFAAKWHPDRRDNDLLNLSIRKIVENLNETSQEVMISQMEKETKPESTDVSQRLEFLLAKSGYIAHEMRNLFSISNLYSEIIERQESKIEFKDAESMKSIKNARECIRKSMKMAANLLLDFKSLRGVDLKEHNLCESINNALELAKIYANGKNIQFINNCEKSFNVLIDENKFLAVLINLIKNAVESIDEKGDIVINATEETENIKIVISNTGNPMSQEMQDKIFTEGVTTKTAGSGLGLVICKKTLEEQFAQLKLIKSDEKSTEFEITVLKG